MQNSHRITLNDLLKQEARSFEEMAEAVLFGDENALALCDEQCEVERTAPSAGCPSFLRAAGNHLAPRPTHQHDQRPNAMYRNTHSSEAQTQTLCSSRLDAELYCTSQDRRFQVGTPADLFVAPMWTPGREDLLLELCGEIDDEDTNLVDRCATRRRPRSPTTAPAVPRMQTERRRQLPPSQTDPLRPAIYRIRTLGDAATVKTLSGSSNGSAAPSRCGTPRSIGQTAPSCRPSCQVQGASRRSRAAVSDAGSRQAQTGTQDCRVAEVP